MLNKADSARRCPATAASKGSIMTTTIERLTGATMRTTTIIRSGAEPYGLRTVTDDSVPVCVRAFPFAAVGPVTAAGRLDQPGAYIIVGRDADGAVAYVGESGNVGARLPDHAADMKRFATEIFVLMHADGGVGKHDAIHWQKCLSDLIEEAGVARLIKGTGPIRAPITPERAAELDRILGQALHLFVDAGCRCLSRVPQPARMDRPADTPSSPSAALPPTDSAEDGDGDEEAGPIEVGVSTVPIGTEEQELAYGDLWARGYQHMGRFVVAAGSEMRKEANPSANGFTLQRRARLIEVGTAVLIGTEDDERYRLEAAVAFPSRAIAAKVLTGAHVGTEKWRPLHAAAPVIIAA